MPSFAGSLNRGETAWTNGDGHKYRAKSTLASFSPRRLNLRITLIAGLLMVVIFGSYTFSDNARTLAHGVTISGLPEEMTTLLRAQHEEMSEIKVLLDKLNRKIDVKDADSLDPRTRKSIERNIDYLHSVDHEHFWAEAPPKVWENKKQEWMDYVNFTMPTWASQKTKFEGRGIVLVGGNLNTIRGIKTTLSMLREYGCKLPVEVHYLDGELNESDIGNLTASGVTVRNLGSTTNLFAVTKKAGKGGKSFHIKTAAMINSGFKEILYLDSDSMPVRDPTYLFDSPDYLRTGTMFFPDFWKTHFTNPIWSIVDTPIVDEWENESGQILLDKESRWDVLLLANHFNRDGDFYFQLINGDKDTLRFASKALRKEYYMVETFLTCGGLIWQDRFCGNTMVQHDHLGAVQFVHANLVKEFTHSELNVDQEEGVFRVFKEYITTRDNTWLKPRFYGAGPIPCMELDVGSGEPDIREDKFEVLLPGWNAHYKKHDGTGGGIDG